MTGSNVGESRGCGRVRGEVRVCKRTSYVEHHKRQERESKSEYSLECRTGDMSRTEGYWSRTTCRKEGWERRLAHKGEVEVGILGSRDREACMWDREEVSKVACRLELARWSTYFESAYEEIKENKRR